MFKVYFEDFTVGVTETYGNYQVSRAEILEFAEKYDPQPFHLNDEAAAQSVFGKLCASGWHTCAMTMRMMVNHMAAQGFASSGSPGIDKIRWKRPVFPHDILHVQATVIEKSDMPNKKHLGLVKASYEVFNQDNSLVMSFIAPAMFLKRPVNES